MSKSQYELKIIQPCSKEWTSMTVGEGGRYCLHCEKMVIDFTNLSDNEIIQHLEKSSKKICSRLSATQLNRILESRKFSQNSQIYRFITGLIFLGSTGNSFGAIKESETKTITVISENIAISNNSIIKEPFEDSIKERIIGTIFDFKTKEVIPFVKIYIKEINSKILADIDGNFAINLPDNFLSDTLTFIVKNVEYKEQEFVFSRIDFFKPLKIFLVTPEEQIIIGELTYVHKKKRWWQLRKKH